MNLPTLAPLSKSWWMAGVSLSILAGCVTNPPAPSQTPAPRVEAPAEPVVSPAGLALAQGLKAYQGAQYAESESQLKLALQLGLSLGTDRANAHKHLAFIYCTSKREALCATSFKAAREADPAFALSKSEAGHPMWSRVYRKALPTKP